MKVKRAIAAITLSVAACTVFVTLVAAQVKVRIVRSSGNSSRSGNSEQPSPSKLDTVEPIDPTPEEAARIAELIEQLGSDRLVQRDRAMSELAGYEARALGQVREGKDDDDDEIAARCGLLEEVIQSRQGELFLAARRLNLTIDELNTYLNNDDVTPLLSTLRARAQAGLVPLWARVFARLAGRSQLYPAAELCIQVEGATGYGQALARAARTPEAANAAGNLMLLMALLPPGEPEDTVEALTQLRYSMADGSGLEQALSSAIDFRGVYAPEASLGASAGRPDPLVKDAEGAQEVRMALAITLTETCTEEQLVAAKLPPADEMSPILLSAWMSLLQRAGLNQQIEAAMRNLLVGGADTRRVSIAAGSYADVTPVPAVIAVFDTLPFEAQLCVLDAWWLRPREPKLLQPFLIKLLNAERLGIRVEAAKALGQYYALSTATALLAVALNDQVVAPNALESLTGMGNLLTPAQLKSLADALPNANLLTRPWIVEILLGTGQADALKPLLKEWRRVLPRNELPMAIRVLALSPETAAGAYAFARTAVRVGKYRTIENYLLQTLDQADLEITRALLALTDDKGFALLRAIATDLNDARRLLAMQALAAAGRDADLISDWLKRMAGEIKDPLGNSIGFAVALSTTDAAEEFKRNAIQGQDRGNLQWVVLALIAGRSRSVTREQLLNALFDTPESAQAYVNSWDLISEPLPAGASRNLATALAFAQGQNLLSQPGVALMLADSGVDILSVLYGETENPTPSDTQQLFTTVLLGNPGRAKAIIEQTEMQPDGSNYLTLTLARAWTGLLPEADSRRLTQSVASSPTSIFGAVLRMRQAKQGDAGALRSLLDAMGPDAVRFGQSATARAELVDQRWGPPYMNTQGVANAAYMPDITPPRLAAAQLRPLFETPPVDSWGSWWSARRALLVFNADTGKYTFTELP